MPRVVEGIGFRSALSLACPGRECDGQISVRTETGKFCEFTLEFPAKGQK